MTKSISIEVTEIHCSNCENTIKTALSRLEGVRVVTPNASDNKVHVTYDEEQVDESRLRTKLTELGYEPLNSENRK